MSAPDHVHPPHTGGPGNLTVALATGTSGIHVVSLAGEVDHATGSLLAEALATVGDGVHPRVVIDLSQVTFMDSSGINILITSHHALTESQGWLRLASPTQAVMRAIRIVGIDAFIDCHATLPRALAA
ncbi:STAS domain-containing protein [Streptomyces sp. NPDC059695]|uniref:STAS domain-containing protein n=1 Tax=Streptomyces sp. NPDC059695 TaxID=3346910 RepID=UPI00369A88C2